MSDRAPIEVEVVACMACDRTYCSGERVGVAPCCAVPVPSPSVTTTATLAPGSLDEARMRLADAVEARNLAWEEWDAIAPDADLDGWRRAQVRHHRAMATEEACLAEVRRLREAEKP